MYTRHVPSLRGRHLGGGRGRPASPWRAGYDLHSTNSAETLPEKSADNPGYVHPDGARELNRDHYLYYNILPFVIMSFCSFVLVHWNYIIVVSL